MVTMKYIAYKPPYTMQYKNILNNIKRKFKQCRFTSTNTCINKMNNHHSPQIIEHKKKKTITYDVINQVPGLGQAQKCGTCKKCENLKKETNYSLKLYYNDYTNISNLFYQ